MHINVQWFFSKNSFRHINILWSLDYKMFVVHPHILSFVRVSTLPTYYVPRDGPLSSYKEYVSMLPNIDHPEAFGQHPNADITSQIQETRLMFDTLLSLQPQITSGSGESREDKVSILFNSLFVFQQITVENFWSKRPDTRTWPEVVHHLELLWWECRRSP